jgi:hypothetical protein
MGLHVSILVAVSRCGLALITDLYVNSGTGEFYSKVFCWNTKTDRSLSTDDRDGLVAQKNGQFE